MKKDAIASGKFRVDNRANGKIVMMDKIANIKGMSGMIINDFLIEYLLPQRIREILSVFVANPVY